MNEGARGETLDSPTLLRAAGTALARPWLAVAAIVAVSAAVRFAIALTFDVPWIGPDEMIYGLVGETLWETGELSIRGLSIPYYSLLTPLVIGLPLSLGDRGLGVALAQGAQALAMSSVAVPAYIWGRRLVGARWALVAATLTVLPPALWYGGLLMTEALFYPLVTASLLALARMLETPTLERQGLFLLLVSLTAAVRLQGLLLLPTLLAAAGLDALFARSTATARKLVPVLAVVALMTATLVVAAAAGEDLLGAYGDLAGAPTPSAGLLSQLAWHGAGVVVMTLGLPLLATATLVVLAVLARERSAPIRAFLAATTAYVVLLVAQVAFFAVDHLDHLGERYLVSALPPLLLGFCVWASRGAPRPLAVAVPIAVGATTLVAALEPDRLAPGRAGHDALTTFPFLQALEPDDAALRVALTLLALGLVAVFLLTPTRLLGYVAVGSAAAFAAISVASAREIDRVSSVAQARDLGATEETWVDDAGADDVLLFDTGELPSTAAARLTFWNRSIVRLARLDEVPGQAIPQVPVTIRRDGALVDGSGQELAAAQAVAPLTAAFTGEALATTPPTEVSPGSRLWRLASPLRLSYRSTGFSPVGDFQLGTVVVYRCGPGRLEVDLLGKEGRPVVVKANGFPYDTVELAPAQTQTVAILPLGVQPGEPCLFELQSEGLAGSTRVEWIPA